jgi:hypothetical protein
MVPKTSANIVRLSLLPNLDNVKIWIQNLHPYKNHQDLQHWQQKICYRKELSGIRIFFAQEKFNNVISCLTKDGTFFPDFCLKNQAVDGIGEAVLEHVF